VRFGELLPRIRRQVRLDLARPGLPREKVLAAVVALLETTRFRVGNEEYARLNRSFGISTLRSRHARVSGSTIRFRFRGKGGRMEERALVDRRLAAVVRRCQDLPGQELFQYPDEVGEPRPIASEDVNDYIREAAGSDELSAKDFRTWTATVLAHRALREALDGHEVEDGPAGGLPKRVVAEALERTADAIGDTVTVTRNSYVHPAVLAAPADAPSTRRRARPGTDHSLTRKDELAVLALLRSNARASSAPRTSETTPARPSIAAKGSTRRRSSRRSA
jgi:DNA topoisomerase-1